MAPKSGHLIRMPPESGGVPGRDHSWEVPYALMLSRGWCANYCSFAVSGGRAGLAARRHARREPLTLPPQNPKPQTLKAEPKILNPDP